MASLDMRTTSEYTQLLHFNILDAELPKRPPPPDESAASDSDTEFFKARCDAIIAILSESEHALRATDLAKRLDISRAAMSEFMRKMRERHLVRSRLQRHGAANGCTFFYWAK